MSEPVEPLRILFVCTANICRSPAAETIARHRFGEVGTLFRSAGFLDSGNPCPEPMIECLRERGVDATRHRSYQLDEPSLRAADLVLTMESEHVQRATMLYRDAFPKILPLKEAAERLGRLEPGPMGIDEFVAAVNRDREPTSYLSTAWDVSDPYRRKMKDYRRAVEEITGLVDVVVGRFMS